jgi:hypothetical protein
VPASPILSAEAVTQRRTAMAYDPPDDEPGDDCPDHGPYADDDCPKC